MCFISLKNVWNENLQKAIAAQKGENKLAATSSLFFVIPLILDGSNHTASTDRLSQVLLKSIPT